ncbi:hypothetical protein K3495_g1122 [Podosphaera aphanis]|nr:hypothetical protein K3495_g1122 [Podosphaera aphanis]
MSLSQHYLTISKTKSSKHYTSLSVIIEHQGKKDGMENAAFTMERSLPSPPAPPDPFMPSSPPFAPPSLPLSSAAINAVAGNRHILQPVPSSKRISSDAVPETTDDDGSKNTDSFLPRKISEIIAASVISNIDSNIDSTITSFRDENRKGEANALRIYLHQVVSLFVASEAPQSPPIPSHSRPAKGTNTSKTKGSKNPVAIATPAIPFVSPLANTSVHATSPRQHNL